MIEDDRKRFLKFLTTDDEVDEAVRQAVRDALEEHRRLNNTVAVWREGRVVLLPADQLLEP